MKKTKYEEVELDIIRFETDDVITDSGNSPTRKYYEQYSEDENEGPGI